MDNDFLNNEQEEQSVTQETQSTAQETSIQETSIQETSMQENSTRETSAQETFTQESSKQQESTQQSGSFSQSYQQQQYHQQPPYQQQYYQQRASYQPDSGLEEPVSFANWMLTKLVMLIPIVNIIMLFVWAFGNTKRSKSNYFKATLAWAIIWIVVAALIAIGLSVCFMMGYGY